MPKPRSIPSPKRCRHVIVVLGDQLDANSPALADADPGQDVVLMVEAPAESTQAWSAKARITFFLAAMRHFAAGLRERGLTVDYLALGTHTHAGLDAAIAAAARRHSPDRLMVVEPGEWRVERLLDDASRATGAPLLVLDDTHFYVSRAEFAGWASGYKQLRMESFYRWMRKRTGVLMEGGEPAGGRWNFDADNRESFGREGPPPGPARPTFPPDAITRSVMEDVERHFQGHPGKTGRFDWPVTRAQALGALEAFARDRLPVFGRHQDAMWTGEPTLSHSLLAAALNVKLLNPREVVAAAEAAWTGGKAPIESVEGFIRQILGWREFIRGMYWVDMPAMAQANHFGHRAPLPRWYWTGQTRMQCMRESIGQTLELGYAHHIQRLMVTGQFALLAGVDPAEVAKWYLGVYVDAVEWAELPNVAGMALYANGGRFTSKPYVASGAYIDRMSNYCRGCPYRPKESTGERACPVTTLYWDFLDRNEREFAGHPRTALMVKNLQRLSDAQRQAIRDWARRTRERIDEL